MTGPMREWRESTVGDLVIARQCIPMLIVTGYLASVTKVELGGRLLFDSSLRGRRYLADKTSIKGQVDLDRVAGCNEESFSREMVRLRFGIGSVFPDRGGVAARTKKRERQVKLAGA